MYAENFFIGLVHRHLKEIDCSLAIVSGQATIWAMVLNLGANQYTGPAYSTKACFIVAGDITTTVSEGGQLGQWVVYLFRCLWIGPRLNFLVNCFFSNLHSGTFASSLSHNDLVKSLRESWKRSLSQTWKDFAAIELLRTIYAEAEMRENDIKKSISKQFQIITTIL